jgi:hypothetical protein
VRIANKELPTNPQVLVSKRFYYFGDKALRLRPELSHLIHSTQGCKRLTDDDIALLRTLVLSKWSIGRHGDPNNVLVVPLCKKKRKPRPKPVSAPAGSSSM